jgi:hypothetical protein
MTTSKEPAEGTEAADGQRKGRKNVSGKPKGEEGEQPHAAGQKVAQEADALRTALFPSLMATALGLDKFFTSHAYKVFLERLVEDAGNPQDPVEVMMLEQLALAHFRIGQLHASAGQAKGIEAAKIYNAVTARMLGEFRRTALALRLYKSRLPEGKAEAKLKIFKAAQ